MAQNNKKKRLLHCNEAAVISTPLFEYQDLFERLVAAKQEKEQRFNRRLFHSFDISTKNPVSSIRPKEKLKVKCIRHGSAKYYNEPSDIVRNNIRYSKKPKHTFIQSANKRFLHTSSVFFSK